MAMLEPWIDLVPKQQRRLGIFIFIALLVHVAMFFFIRIDSTRAELRHTPRVHVTVENPPSLSQEASAGDGFWDRLTDPRVFILPIGSTAGLATAMPPIELGNMNAGFGPRPLPDPAPAEDYQFGREVVLPLEQRAAEAVNPTRQPFTYRTAAPAIIPRTTWQWDAALVSLTPSAVPELPSPISDTDLSPTQLRVAVRADGSVEHAFVEQSCGSGRLDLDQQAVLAARKIRFKPGDRPDLTWGRITVFWNYTAKPREEVVPTPLTPGN